MAAPFSRWAVLEGALRLALRRALRERGYTAVHVLSLAVGFAACLLIGLTVYRGVRFDRSVPEADRVARLVTGTFGEIGASSAHTPPALARAATRFLPDVDAVTRLYGRDEVPLRIADRVSIEPRVYFADSAFFEVFRPTVVRGSTDGALLAPRTAWLTESAAMRLFGRRDVVGRTFEANTFFDFVSFEVTGILADPDATHLPYGILLAQSSLAPGFDDPNWWHARNVYTYVRFGRPLAAGDGQQALDRLAEQTALPVLAQREGQPSIDALKAVGRAPRFFTQPLTDIYLDDALTGEPGPSGSRDRLRLMAVVALVILLLAIINFVNLATARATRRAREVGVRKVLGAARGRLVVQFLVETAVLTGIALGLGLVLAWWVRPVADSLVGLELPFEVLATPIPLAILAIGVLLVSGVAGLYPALGLSRYEPAAVLKGSPTSGRSGHRLRSGLIVFQLVVTFVLLTASAVVYRQMDFLAGKDLGFRPDHLLYVDRAWTLEVEPAASLRNDLLARADIDGVAYAGKVPGRWPVGPVEATSDGARSVVAPVRRMTGNIDLLDVLGLPLVVGRGFTEAFAADSAGVLVNEAAVRRFGWDDPVGKTLRLGTSPPETVHVVGVVADFHFESLHAAIEPLVIRPEYEGIQGNVLLVRTRGGDVRATIDAIEAAWRARVPTEPFVYGFVDDAVDSLYRADRRTRDVLAIATLLALLIGIMGLAGLASYQTETRTREIGVRKVLGASAIRIIGLLAGTYLRLAAVGLVIAVPLGIIAGKEWQASFAYRASLPLWIPLALALAAASVLVVAVGIQTWRAATADPVRSIRHE